MKNMNLKLKLLDIDILLGILSSTSFKPTTTFTSFGSTSNCCHMLLFFPLQPATRRRCNNNLKKKKHRETGREGERYKKEKQKQHVVKIAVY